MTTVLTLLLVAAMSCASLALVVRLINSHVNEAIDRHVAAALPDHQPDPNAPRSGDDFDVHVSQALGIVDLPRPRTSLDDAQLRHQK